MKFILFITVLLLLTMTFMGCNVSSQSKVENPRLKTFYLGDLTVQVKLRERTHTDYDGQEFVITFTHADISKLTAEKFLYLDFDIEKDFSLDCQGRLLHPSIAQAVRTGVRGKFQYIARFDHEAMCGHPTKLHYQDKVFAVGNLMFVFDQDL